MPEKAPFAQSGKKPAGSEHSVPGAVLETGLRGSQAMKASFGSGVGDGVTEF